MTEPVPTPLDVELEVDPVHAVAPVGPEPRNLAEEVEGIVLALPGVVRMDGGAFGGLGTYLPGRRVTGVRIDDEEGTEVHIVVDGSEPVPAVADRVLRAVAAIAPTPVHVHVEDIDLSMLRS
ncbi:hypothetical protein ACPPVS_17925 [Cellulomonas sp. McL0617]|uniref:hypothetical protein n=1 Tax=Cellulomonas sp. McL0617 TaxID=3415675 RepID=UPI003CE752AD